MYLTDDLRRRLAKDQRGLCFYCHLRLHDDMTWEHLVARHHGGDNSLRNLRISHSVCNSLVGVLDAQKKIAISEIGATYGSDAFFLLMERLKSEANPNGKTFAAVRRPKRPSPQVHRINIEKLLSFLPDEIVMSREMPLAA